MKLLSTTSNVVGVLEKDKLLPWPVLPITKKSRENKELLSAKVSPCKLESYQEYVITPSPVWVNPKLEIFNPGRLKLEIEL